MTIYGTEVFKSLKGKSKTMVELVFVLAFVLWIVHIIFYNSRWLENYYDALLSFGSGLLISVIFTEILPLLFVDAAQVVAWRFLAIVFLLGFLSYHVLEKHTYQNARSFIRQRKQLTLLHGLGFLLDNFLKGILLFLFFTLPNPSRFAPFILFGALSVRMASNALNFRNFHERHLSVPHWFVVLVSLSVVLGVLFAHLISSHSHYLYLLFSFISGAFTYFVIRDEIPQGKYGKPLFFTLGILLVILFLLVFK